MRRSADAVVGSYMRRELHRLGADLRNGGRLDQRPEAHGPIEYRRCRRLAGAVDKGPVRRQPGCRCPADWGPSNPAPSSRRDQRIGQLPEIVFGSAAIDDASGAHEHLLIRAPRWLICTHSRTAAGGNFAGSPGQHPQRRRARTVRRSSSRPPGPCDAGERSRYGIDVANETALLGEGKRFPKRVGSRPDDDRAPLANWRSSSPSRGDRHNPLNRAPRRRRGTPREAYRRAGVRGAASPGATPYRSFLDGRCGAAPVRHRQPSARCPAARPSRPVRPERSRRRPTPNRRTGSTRELPARRWAKRPAPRCPWQRPARRQASSPPPESATLTLSAVTIASSANARR